MVLIHTSRDVKATLDSVWDVVSDIDRELEFWHGTKSIKNISKTGNTIEREVVIAFRNSKCRRLYLPPYTEEQFLKVAAKVLPKLKVAHVIGKAVWEQRGDIRDVIAIGKLVRENDGPAEVESILNTMVKYGENALYG